MAVGTEKLVERTREELGILAKGREEREMEGQFELREPRASYQRIRAILARKEQYRR